MIIQGSVCSPFTHEVFLSLNTDLVLVQRSVDHLFRSEVQINGDFTVQTLRTGLKASSSPWRRTAGGWGRRLPVQTSLDRTGTAGSSLRATGSCLGAGTRRCQRPERRRHKQPLLEETSDVWASHLIILSVTYVKVKLLMWTVRAMGKFYYSIWKNIKCRI